MLQNLWHRLRASDTASRTAMVRDLSPVTRYVQLIRDKQVSLAAMSVA